MDDLPRIACHSAPRGRLHRAREAARVWIVCMVPRHAHGRAGHRRRHVLLAREAPTKLPTARDRLFPPPTPFPL